jgi:hypothetical protein
MKTKLDRLVQMEKAATPAPFWATPKDLSNQGLVPMLTDRGEEMSSLVGYCRIEDWVSMVSSRNALPDLLAVAQAAEELLDDRGPCDNHERGNQSWCLVCRLRQVLAPLLEPCEERK